MKHSLGFTLIEVLCVIAIVCLLAGLMMPALIGARAEAKKASCTSQLHQIGIALNLYRSDFGEMPASRDLAVLSKAGYLSEKALLVCPDDPFGGLWQKEMGCRSYKLSAPQSYYTPLTPDLSLWKDLLLPADDNPGVLACRSHGTKTDSFKGASSDLCRNISWIYDEKVLRLRQDGSVQVASFSLAPPADTPSVKRRFSLLRLFTDADVMSRFKRG